MTISTTTSRISYNGNGVTTIFSFPYRFLANGDLVVLSVSAAGVETTKVLTTDYTLTGAGDDAGGSVTMLVAPASGTRLIIYRDTDITQETDYISGDPFPAETHERALDRLTMIAQEIGSDADRSIKVPVGDSSSLSTTLPASANRLDKFLVFDATTGEAELSAVTQTQVASAVAAAYAAGSTADAVTFLQGGTGAESESVQVALRRFVHIDQFGAVGDATTDDLVPLTNFWNSAIANPGVPHRLGDAIYACSAALPTINVSGVLIYGVPGGSHDVGTFSGTVIRAITGNSGTMLTVAPDSGASNQGLHGWVIDGVTLDCAGVAARGLIVKSSRHFWLNTYVANATTDGLTLDVQTTLGESKDTQYGLINYRARQVETPGGVALRVTGDGAANTSFNLFNLVDIIHKDATGIIEVNADNNTWNVCRVFRAAGGSATNSIEWQGGASAAVGCRAERFGLLSTTVAAIAKGTGTYTVPANGISIDRLDVENGSPAPTVETGASVAGPQIAWTPTITASSGTFTATSATAFYQLDPADPLIVEGRIAIAITTNGTAAGEVRATLPFTSSADGVAAAVVGYEGSTGVSVLGIIGTSSNSLRILKYDGTYPGGSGTSLTLVFRYRRAP